MISKFDSSGLEVWNKIYDLNSYSLNFVVTSDGYAIGGTRYVSGFSTTKWIFSIIKTDTAGNVSWVKDYNAGPSESPIDFNFCKTNENGFYLVGWAPDSTNYWGDIIIKTDSLGNIIWNKKNYNFFYNINVTATTDGGAAFLGADSLPTGYLTVTRVDASGNLLWQKGYIGSVPIGLNSNGNNFICDAGNGCFMIVTLADDGVFSDWNIAVIYVDSSGNVLWSKMYGGVGKDRPLGIQKTTHGKFLISGDSESFTTNDFFSGYLLKIDSLGNIEWDMVYGDSLYESNIKSVAQTSDTGLIITGFYVGDLLLIKTDSLGNSGCRNFSPTTSIYPLTVQSWNAFPVPSSKSIIVDTPAVTVSTAGYMAAFCNSTIGISEMPIKNVVSVFPNPFHETAVLEVGNLKKGNCYLKIYNSMGSLVRTETIKDAANHVLHRGNLEDGFYFYELRPDSYRDLNSELIGTGKFILN